MFALMLFPRMPSRKNYLRSLWNSLLQMHHPTLPTILAPDSKYQQKSSSPVTKMETNNVVSTLFFALAMAAPAPTSNTDNLEARDGKCPSNSLCLGGQFRSFQCIGGGPTACGYYPISQTC